MKIGNQEIRTADIRTLRTSGKWDKTAIKNYCVELINNREKILKLQQNGGCLQPETEKLFRQFRTDGGQKKIVHIGHYTRLVLLKQFRQLKVPVQITNNNNRYITIVLR